MKNYLSLLLICLVLVSGWSQQSPDSTMAVKEEKNIDFTVMPYLSYNRNLEFMIGVLPMMMYRVNPADTISPKSMSGLSAIYTTNKSYIIAAFTRIYLMEDHWRLQTFFVTGDQNSQFFMDDDVDPGFYDYSTHTTIFKVGAQRKIARSLFLGLAYIYADYNTDYYDVQEPTSTSTNSLELSLLADRRDNIYYPTTGYRAKLNWKNYSKWFGNDEAVNRISAEYNRYYSLRREQDVLAARFSGQFGLGNVPFEQQVVIGNKDIRGYSEGKYRGDGIIALQGEYRWNFNEKMGLVGFAGLATLYGSDTEDFNWDLYPGGGIGYRYRAFKRVKFNVGLDAAVGKGDWGIYFRIGESF